MCEDWMVDYGYICVLGIELNVVECFVYLYIDMFLEM